MNSQDRPPAPLALLKSTLLELLKIDTTIPDEDFKNIQRALVEVFFQGKIYFAYDTTTGSRYGFRDSTSRYHGRNQRKPLHHSSHRNTIALRYEGPWKDPL